jgi:hypothetical protein
VTVSGQHPDRFGKEAASKYFADVFGDWLEEMAQEGTEKAGKVRRIVNVFRFLCPSYYISGDQEWGVF